MSEGRRQRLWVTALLVTAGALIIGLGSGWALLVTGAILGGLVVVRWPIVGVLFFAVTIPLENLVIVGEATLTRLLGMGVFAGWLAHKILFRESWKALARNPLVVPATLFIALAAISMLWAQEPRLTRADTLQLLRLFAMALLLLDVVDGWEKLEWVVRVLVVGAVAASLITLYQYHFTGLARAGEDISGNVNATAALLVTLVPFAFYMLQSSQSAGWRLLGCTALAVSIAAVAVTFSRMSLLLLPPLLALQCWRTIRTRRGTAWLAGVAAGVAIVAVFTIPWREVERRTSTILPYLAASVADPGGSRIAESSSRAFHLRAGIAMFADHPVLGVGYGNYSDYFLREYQFQVEGSEKLWRHRRSPHSSNIGILADLGLVGLSLWIVLLGVGFFAVFKAWRTMRRVAYRSDGFLLVQAVTYAYLLQAVAFPWYGESHTEKLFWMILSLGVVADGLARQTATSLDREVEDRRSDSTAIRRRAPSVIPVPSRG